ncbi:hypothetical protein HDZ31DRAFT_60290 [Schizophyllum fasciatum]
MAHATRTMTSPRDYNDEHVRHLLDQRFTRADLHRDGRWDSVSEFSDSPSIYSRAVFSPNANDQGVSSPPLHTPRTHRERFDDPSASMLDLDDDPRSSLASSVSYGDDDKTVSEHDSDEPVPRMSYLGPKMRFHSRAPWEMDSETLDEQDEEPEEPPSRKALFGGGRQDQRRPSLDSVRSNKVKKSFDSTSSGSGSQQRGALHALAQAGMSSTSLVAPNATGPSGLRNMFAISRTTSPSSIDSRPTSPAAVGAPSQHAGTPFERHGARAQASQQLRPDTFISNDSASTYDSFSEDQHAYAHPYAHPSVVPKYEAARRQASPPRSIPTTPASVQRPAVTVVTEGKVMPPERSRTLTTSPATPRSPVLGRARSSTFQGKEISSPVLLSRTEAPPLPNQPFDTKLLPMTSLPSTSTTDGAPWPEPSPAPAFSLISLEEAQANQRTRSNTVQSSTGGPAPDVVSFAPVPFPETDDTRSINGDFAHARNRVRSTSAGSRARHALHTMVAGTPPRTDLRELDPANAPPSGKQLKHKRSGFMRIFNGSREKDEKPPPVPSLAEGYASFNSQQSLQNHQKRTPKIPRVPVPQLSPTISSDEQAPSNVPLTPGRGPTKRSPPLLSINTQRSPSAHDPRFIAPAVRNESPLSAPAHVHEFPAPLKLRPVSTLFSALGEHISHDGDEPDSGSLSPPTVLSPITPVSGGRDPAPAVAGDDAAPAGAGDDPSAVIRALQAQIAGARKAWQRHVWELEGQVRDLKAEVEELRAAEAPCAACGRGRPRADGAGPARTGVVNRPRARTGIAASRFGSHADYD